MEDFVVRPFVNSWEFVYRDSLFVDGNSYHWTMGFADGFRGGLSKVRIILEDAFPALTSVSDRSSLA